MVEADGSNLSRVSAWSSAMIGDSHDQGPPDLGRGETIDPFDEQLHFLEDPLSRSKIEAVRPFDDRASLAGGSPVRVVVDADGDKFIMQGNHRIFAAREDEIKAVGAIVYTPRQWRDSFEYEFQSEGTNNPTIGP